MGCLCSRGATTADSTPYQRVGRATLSQRALQQQERDAEALRGRYELLDPIGKGTTSTVYSCRRAGYQAEDPQLYSCKVVNLRKFANDALAAGSRLNVIEQLRVEIQVLRSLRHPNIISLVDVVESGEKLFIITELMDCELFEYIVEQSALREREAATLMHDIVSAISYMHEQGVMHRDLKPENLLMKAKADGSGYVVKVVDFGLSRTDNLQGTTFMGTAGYLAPELRQRKIYSKAVDVWGLGVIMYLLLSGTMPFGAEVGPLPGAQPPVAEYALRFPGERWEGVSAEAKHLLWCMLQVEPDLRISAADLLAHPWIAGRAGAAGNNVVPSLHGLPLDKGFNSFFLEPHTVGTRSSVPSPPSPGRESPQLSSSARPQLRKAPSAPYTDSPRAPSSEFTVGGYVPSPRASRKRLTFGEVTTISAAPALVPEEVAQSARRKVDASRNRPIRSVRRQRRQSESS